MLFCLSYADYSVKDARGNGNIFAEPRDVFDSGDAYRVKVFQAKLPFLFFAPCESLLMSPENPVA